MDACIFNIQKFSLHDGPGIRAVVFFKGCPLRCAWCANPESQRMRPEILRDAALCALCGECARACPHGAICVCADFRLNARLCTGCGVCAPACPNRALTLEGRMMSLGEVLHACEQDRPFYEESGGGVTLSGGEALAQPVFARAFLVALRARGIHTAIETTGYAPEEVFRSVCGAADLILFDMKHWDDGRHMAGTGVGRAQIMANLRAAVESGWELLVRIPVIRGNNDAETDAAGFAAALCDVGITRAQLLPFHQFGEAKYAALGRAYAYNNAPAMHADALAGYIRAFHARGAAAYC